jgi:hypothetical protein
MGGCGDCCDAHQDKLTSAVQNVRRPSLLNFQIHANGTVPVRRTAVLDSASF